MQRKQIKRKKNVTFLPEDPLPIKKILANKKVIGKFNGFSVVIEEKRHMELVYKNGFFGKSNFSDLTRFNRKRSFELREKLSSKNKFEDSDSENEHNPDFINEKLILNLEEAFFLMHGINCIEILNENKSLKNEEAWTLFSNTDKYFIQNYVAYYYYRSREWVVKPGLKFGGDLMLYKEGPSVNHASYVVIIDIIDPETLERRKDMCRRNMSIIEIVGLNRLCENCGKELVICQLLWPEKINVDHPDNINQISVNEILSKRWIPSRERENVATDKE